MSEVDTAARGLAQRVNRFVIADPEKCIGCYTCEAGCVNVHEKAGLAAYPRLQVTHTVLGTMPLQCRNCDDAPCEKVCPVKAITFEDRSVQLNESTCIGCKLCALACPFGAITPWGEMPKGADDGTDGTYPEPAAYPEPTPLPPPPNEPVHPILAWAAGQRSVAVKCDLCHFRPEGPECIRVCPTKALHIVESLEIDALIARRRLASGLGVMEKD
jgi:hydrogenase-4 component A